MTKRDAATAITAFSFALGFPSLSFPKTLVFCSTAYKSTNVSMKGIRTVVRPIFSRTKAASFANCSIRLD
ncbi:hypothetical protein DRJ25_02115 [Candidatus Woesearchaeota archaeon]|nr:MAG: hypothetical protein DRJ25_02115 [Candidatus Woesearchaeota archaeon]